MSTKEVILNKIQILISNSFETPEKAFSFFDDDDDGKLSKKEISELLKKAEISGLIRGIVTNKLIEGYDKDGDALVNWSEFKAAVDEIGKKTN
ncbi:EF-hand domain-containing protein [Subsaxibacter sp. CAU 1640]|uniref:EF-hand domain-containing protein n=1 Tax=Subsaxibacter sp. CAU 1640 TaxID=2933271 RepID=UPI002002E98A|nr:EF-hand domain-containing protein [Subsaxibacter sp. CAU 1640]MCK7589831.1 EF-hand domain-containing protein [Subsaxibacter sp. CAU 1640]